VELGLPTGEIVVTLLRVAVTMTVYTVLGVAFGALLRNQVAALLVVVAYFYLGEFALLLIPGVNAVYAYLPGGASAALTGFTYLAEATANQTGGAAAELLSTPTAALVLLGYAVVAAAIAIAVPLRRDVT
jgi:ABC-2 type transport system permease protein